MQCPECQFENPEDSNFCLECGKKFEQKCPQCEKTLPVGAKFCNGCGRKLTVNSAPSPEELSFDEKLDKIQRYLPKGLTGKILAQRGRIEGEHKQVTVMFCDMEGFTHLTEKLGSEEYLKGLLDCISGEKVFLVFTYRPEFVHPWGGRSYHNQVTLNRLSNRESHAMVTYILGTEDIDSNLEELILEKTEGIPFFIEEFIKSIKGMCDGLVGEF